MKIKIELKCKKGKNRNLCVNKLFYEMLGSFLLFFRKTHGTISKILQPLHKTNEKLTIFC